MPRAKTMSFQELQRLQQTKPSNSSLPGVTALHRRLFYSDTTISVNEEGASVLQKQQIAVSLGNQLCPGLCGFTRSFCAKIEEPVRSSGESRLGISTESWS